MGETLNHSQKASRRLLLRIVVISTFIGAFYGFAISRVLYAEFHWSGVLQGAFCGATISAWCGSLDIWQTQTRWGSKLRHLSFARYVALKTLYYAIGIEVGIYLGDLLFSPLYGGAPWAITDPEFIVTFVLALTLSAGFNFMLEISRLLGPNVLRNFITGRYHQPHEEERVFLFVDMIDSTQIAEHLGNVQFHRLLDDFFTDLTEPILATAGEIHAYVGDQVIVTWPLAQGVSDSRCLDCYRMMREILEIRRNTYIARYGFTPDFRAALHAGPVVTGEMGVQKRQIVLLGDTVNTTARMEQVARDLDQPAVISASLLRQMQPPSGIQAVPLGARRLRGKDIEVELYSLQRTGDSQPSEAA